MGNALSRLLDRTVVIEEAKLERPLDPRLRWCAIVSSGIALASLVFFVVRQAHGDVGTPDIGFFFVGNGLVSAFTNFLGSASVAFLNCLLLLTQLGVVFFHYYRGGVKPSWHRASGGASIGIATLALLPMATLVGLVALHAALWIAVGVVAAIAAVIVGFIAIGVALSYLSSS